MVNLATAIAIIKATVKTLPDAPGVYRMLGENDQVLYVGKARSLKKRVLAYTRLEGLPLRLQRMVAQTAKMEIVTTHTEAEALLLEASLIKSLKPRYNILMKDDKSYPYVRIGRNHPFPRISKYRGARQEGEDYYGPYASAGAVQEVLVTLQKAFLLRPCSDTVFRNRSRPCLQYHIKRCSAPCVGLIEESAYAALLDEARAFLDGKSQGLQSQISAAMEAASQAMDYEKAAQLRDRLRALSRVQGGNHQSWPSILEADVLAVALRAGRAVVQHFIIRDGQNRGNRVHRLNVDDSTTPEDLLQTILTQTYAESPAPKKILLSHWPDEAEMLMAALSQKEGRRVTCLHPKRGEGAEAVGFALKNAEDALSRWLTESAAQHQLLAAVAELFGMALPPERIEIYDNSHMMGDQAVGVMVVAGPEGFIKNAYRKYSIQQTPGDDFGMMREVMTRRFRNWQAADAAPLPQLMIIDGGKGQVSSTMAALRELGLEGKIRVTGMAKGPERNAGREWFHPAEGEPFQLPEGDPALYYLQRLRDEAHRFAIGSFRQKKRASLGQSPLDALQGVGPARKKALLQFFGSAQAVRQASPAEISRVPGISPALAEKIFQQLRD